MYTASELALLRASAPGVVIPGIDVQEGNPLPASSLKSYTTITTNSSAPVFYDPAHNRVVVKGNGTVLSGYDFSGVSVDVWANNVTITNCNFNGFSGALYSVNQESGYNGLTVKNSTFDGSTGNNGLPCVLQSVNGSMTVTNDSFIDTPQHAIHIPKGVVSNNYFSGSGYVNGTHADAIGVFGTSGPVLITNNFIDWTTNAGASTPSNNAIRITTDTGNTSNVTVTGNYIIGGTYSLFALPSTIVYLPPGGSGTLGTVGTMTNVNISNNYVGFSQFGSIYPTPAPGVTYSNNTTFDFSNPIYATEAWADYQAAGIPTAQLQVSSGASLTGSATGSTTLYGAGYLVHLMGTANETNFIGGLGTQYINGGAGANIFTYLTFSNSTLQHPDIISNFSTAKDVIDLSRIDANPAVAGIQNFSFIGAAAFSGSGTRFAISRTRPTTSPMSRRRWPTIRRPTSTSSSVAFRP